MPAIFHRLALEAAAGKEFSNQVPDQAFEDYHKLAPYLDLLSPEVRCTALYADWILQLLSPSHQSLLQVRNLLLGQGALAANYLAELAQNADDAADGNDAEVRIMLDGNWLLVSNNGKKISSLNLFGLTRFFVHAAGKIHNLDQETIGRFGIGFKASYRFASEIWIHTWDSAGSFTFRIPICAGGIPESDPDHERLDFVRRRLAAVGVSGLDGAFKEVINLGYCTPEWFEALPSQLQEPTAMMRTSDRGTLFCLHIRPDRADEVRSRVSGQEHELYELCPLFLPNVRLVQVAQNELRMKVMRRDATDDLAGRAEATRIELSTTAPGAKTSNSRFWRLRGIADGDLWQLALHADSKFRLHLKQEEDEHGTTVKDGAAYAFFPLNAVTWPLRLHLHIKLPTNLARDNWNPDDAPRVKDQIRRAIAGLAQWLQHKTANWHSDWQVSALVASKPTQSDIWARIAWECLAKACLDHRIVRTLTGGFSTSRSGRALRLLAIEGAADAWRKVWATAPGSEALIDADTDELLSVPNLTVEEVSKACREAAVLAPADDEVQHASLLALLSSRDITLRALTDALAAIVCRTAAGETVPLRELLAEPSGTELTDDWHKKFALLTSAAKNAVWRNITVAGQPLPQQFEKLSEPVFCPPWRQLSSRLSTEADWAKHGEAFWRNPRSPCPTEHLDAALEIVRVPDAARTWRPISTVWLDDDTSVACFAGLLDSWGLRYADSERKRMTGLLKSWGLFEAWERSTKRKLTESLPEQLLHKLNEQCGDDAFAVVFDQAYDNARPQDGGWAHLVIEAERLAVARFVQARSKVEEISGKTLLSSSIDHATRQALCLLEDFIPAPPWLSDFAYRRICRLGLQEKLPFTFRSKDSLREHRFEYCRRLLASFYKWDTGSLTDVQATGFQELFKQEKANDIRNVPVGLSTQRQRLLRSFLAGSSHPETVSSPEDRLMARRLAVAKKHVEALPPALASVPALVEAAANLSRLVCERSEGGEVALEAVQVSEIAEADPDIGALIQKGVPIFGASRGLSLRWHEGDQLVAELADADAGWFGDRLIFGRFARPENEEQYNRLLALYELCGEDNDDYRKKKRAGASPFELYSVFRSQIVQILVKRQVRDVGYSREHILRELLQNAESAYASKREPVADAWFDFTIEPATLPGDRVVRAKHAGRAFNEADRDGKERCDTERIIKIEGANQNTDGELGRFNKGFKAVFTVAKDGRVRIRSGSLMFEVLDLLLMNPAVPREEHPTRPDTTFEFAVAQADALGMLGFSGMPAGSAPPPVLNPTSFLFLSQLRRITVSLEKKSWHWTVATKELGDGWTEVRVSESTSMKSEIFLVHHGRLADRRRFGVAVRYGTDGHPRTLEREWRSLRLTFDTESAFGLDVIVNGDFQADQGRVNLRGVSSDGADIILAALGAALRRADSALTGSFSAPQWLGWAKALHLKDASSTLESARLNNGAQLSDWIERMEATFTRRVPCLKGSRPLETAGLPSRLMRKLARSFEQRWGIESDSWILLEAEEQLSDPLTNKRSKFRFPAWLSTHAPLAAVLQTVSNDLRQPAFAPFRQALNKAERDELSEAEEVLEAKLQLAAPTQPAQPQVQLPVVDAWSVADLWNWWEQNGKPTHDYTLEGPDNWRLLYGDDSDSQEARQERLRKHLKAAESPEGKSTWYRLFGLACLMAAGRRMTELRTFWHEELESRRFWVSTSDGHFAKGTDALFDELMRRQYADLNASGEHAYFWRRVFYDVRKIHRLVWEDSFPAVLLELIHSGRGNELLNFLKTGTLAGQKNWSRVFGQSAGAPLFFLVRELVRLKVISGTEVQPLAFFVSTPVRRAMARIGWLDPVRTDRSTFESLWSISSDLHSRIVRDRTFGPKLLPFHDIPLLHLGLTSS